MNKYEAEIFKADGEAILNLARKEFTKGFVIVARTPEHFVLGDSKKNVCISRGSRIRVTERHAFTKTNSIQRKV